MHTLSTPIHSFDVSYAEAKRIQMELRTSLDLVDTIGSPEDIDLVGGADVAFVALPGGSSAYGGTRSTRTAARDDGKRELHALAVAVTFDTKRREIAETAYTLSPVRFPYIPGFLTFREGPAVLAAIGELKTLPGVMLYDGAGIAHPRGLGIASHMALLTGIPSIGCAKSLLTGVCEEPGPEKGDWTYIFLDGHPGGVCLRTRQGVKPMYISPGNGFSIEGAGRFVLGLTGSFRLPGPTRAAHMLAARRKAELLASGL